MSRQMKCAAIIASLALLAVCASPGGAWGQSPADRAEYQLYVQLIKNTLTAVNHANLTGNYAVLRELGSQRFRQRKKAADLGITFHNLRQQQTDLSPILLQEPQFTQRPAVGPDGRVQLVGYFPTRPLMVHFGLTFQRVEAGYLIDEITIRLAAPERPAPPWGSGPGVTDGAAPPRPGAYRPR